MTRHNYMPSRAAAFLAILVATLLPAAAGATVSIATALPREGAVIAPVGGEHRLDSLAELLGETTFARLSRALGPEPFSGGIGAAFSFPTGEEGLSEVHLIGVGPDPLTPRDIEDFGGRAAGLASKSKATKVSILAPGAGAEEAARTALGYELGSYRFDKYKSGASDKRAAVEVISADPGAAARFRERHAALASAVRWTRDQQTEPANVLYPEEFVRRARELFKGLPGLRISVLDENDMKRLGMGALEGVGRGSARPPRLFIVEYRGAAADVAPIAYVGKGITFDSGGISIKPNAGMWQMKQDMSGAAVVVGTVYALAQSRAQVNVVALAALAENMPSGSAIRPGDVLQTMSGKTVEVLSTDAEGRLVLADAVWYAQERFKPKLLVDVATLTGSVSGALSDEYAGLLTRDDALADRLIAVGKATGEELWRLPLHPNHFKQIKSDIADIKNSDTGAPGASTGAAFIGAFVKEDLPWAHLDIAGVDLLSEGTPTSPKGPSGFGVKLLESLAREEAKH